MGVRAGRLVQTHIDLAFADGEYRFALGLAQIAEIQRKCDAGIGAIYARVLQGRVGADVTVAHSGYAAYRHEDLVETVRQGLIGGGQGVVDGQDVKVSSLRANELVERYLLALPLVEQWNLAAAVLFAKVEGYEPAVDQAGEGDTTEKKTPTDVSTTQAH